MLTLAKFFLTAVKLITSTDNMSAASLYIVCEGIKIFKLRYLNRNIGMMGGQDENFEKLVLIQLSQKITGIVSNDRFLVKNKKRPL